MLLMQKVPSEQQCLPEEGTQLEGPSCLPTPPPAVAVFPAACHLSGRWRQTTAAPSRVKRSQRGSRVFQQGSLPKYSRLDQ